MIPTMEKQPLRLGVFKLRRLNNLTLPWPTRKQPEDTGKKVIEIKTKKALSTLWPLDELEAPLKKKLNFDYIEESFNELLQCSRGIRKNSSRRLSSTFSQIPQASLAPITPHTKKTRRKRAAKKNVAPPTRRSTRTTRTSKVHLSNISILPEIQENSSNVSENEDFTTPLKEPMKKRKMVKMTIPEPEPKTPVQINEIHSSTPDQISEHVGENNVQMVTPEPVHRNEAELEELNETPEAMEGVTESGIEHENNIDDTPTEVKNLISLHETLIKNSTKTGNLKRTSDNADEDKNHSSPVLKLTADTNESNKRSMEDQVKSCVKKKPIVNIARLKLLEVSPMIYSDSPQKPITLTFDASDDEDIADNNTEMNENNSIEPVGLLKPPTMSGLTGTPCSTVPANNPVPSRRSLNFHLQLSGAESDLENSISTDHCDRVEAQPQTSGTIEQDSLEAVDGEEVHNDTNATTSMASSSVCSSSAATVVFDSEDYSSVSQEDSCSEVEEKTPVVARRSTRCSKRKSIVTGLASKRLSVTAKLAAKRHDADEKAFEKSLVMTNDDDNEDSSDEEKIKKKPKIVKPVRKPPRTVLKSTSRLPVSCSSNRVVSETKKRTLDEVEMRGPMSPCPQPKQKYIKCASPLCHDKSKTKPAQKTRNTFLNRSTAASRARRTPNKTPTMGSRTRAALIAGSPFKFTSQSVCLSPVPRPANLTCEVQSFIRRNTPQKINYEDLMAAKKQQLEEKEKREKELKRKKMEEKQKKIEQKRRQRSARLRKVAEQREEKARIEKEKQQKQIEQWEKRIVNADKVKILRKNEEVAKSKKVQKKQAEAEELRKREEEERIRRVKEQEQETDQRLHEQKLLREQEAALKKQVEQERIMEKKRQDKIREEKEAAEEMKRMEEDKMKREEEEKTKRKKADDALKLKQQKIEKEELERKRKMQDEIDKRNAEASRLEQERIEKEKESQRKIQEDVKRRQEEAVRRKEKEEARKRKLEEAKAVAEEKAMRRKQEELARTEELRHKREEIRRQAEKRREEERQQREEEKKKLDEEKMRLQEIAKQEKLRKIQESNEKIRQLEAAHKQERERRRLMDESLCQTPGNNPNSTYNVDTSTLHASPQSYDMTPQVIKVFAQSTEDNYNIDDIASDDETDDDEDPRKVVPKWAKGANLRSQLIKQYYTPPNMLLIFCDALPAEGVRLDKIFTKAPKPRYYNRTSSAHWTSPIMPPGHISFTDQCRGFEE